MTQDFDENFKHAEYFIKNAIVSAIVANGGEEITTILSDGHEETKNVAQKGDYIVTNPGGEKYILKPDNFNDKYETSEQEGRYVSRGKPVKAVEIINNIKFIAPWGEEQKMRAGDFIIQSKTIDGTFERYGIGRKEFLETYKKFEANK